jgi:predicted Zn-dependent protease
MKKVILSFAVIAGLGTLTSVNASNISNDEANVITVWQDNGYVDVTPDSLNEKVQASINAILQEYELNSLQYNAEKQITKLEATHKSDKSVKVFYFDAEGKEIKMEAPAEEQKTDAGNTATSPNVLLAESFETSQDSDFVDVKFEELNEKVQAAVRVIDQTYYLNALQYNAEKQITKVEATKKDDNSKKTFYLDAEGNEIEMESSEKNVESTSGTQAPSIETMYAMQDDGFVEVKLEDLNEKVQEAVRTISETYELNSLQYNAEKQITKVVATKKDDQSKKTFYLDKDGVETTMDQSSAPLQNTSEGAE